MARTARKRSSRKSAGSKRPEMWIIAGPNGAGKSSYLESAAIMVSEVVRPDELARRISPRAPESAALSAGRLAVERMRALIDSRSSFAVETTLSGRLHLELAQQAQSAGWSVKLVFIGLDSSALAIRRVRQRTLEGGHNVPPEHIIRRYQRSLDGLRSFLGLANEVRILDNSSTRQKMRLILIAQRGKISWRTRRTPEWLVPIITARRVP